MTLPTLHRDILGTVPSEKAPGELANYAACSAIARRIEQRCRHLLVGPYPICAAAPPTNEAWSSLPRLTWPPPEVRVQGLALGASACREMLDMRILHRIYLEIEVHEVVEIVKVVPWRIYIEHGT